MAQILQPRWEDLVGEPLPDLTLRWGTGDELAGGIHGAVTKPHTIDFQTDEPVPGGLYDPEVFGQLPEPAPPEAGPRPATLVALKDLTSRFGRIDLPTPVLHSLWFTRFRDQLEEATAWTPEEVQRLVEMQTQYVDGQLRPREAADGSEFSGAAAIRERLQERGYEQTPIILESIPVLPLLLRPLGTSPSGRPNDGELNDRYRQVVNTAWRIRRMKELDAPARTLVPEIRKLQLKVDRLFDNEHPDVDSVYAAGPRLLPSLVSLLDAASLSAFDPETPLHLLPGENAGATLATVRALQAMCFEVEQS
jgi:DNA-directed RNA polymerase beta' subunit